MPSHKPALRRFLAGALLSIAPLACDSSVFVGRFEAGAGGAPGSGGTVGGAGTLSASTSSSAGGSSGEGECVKIACQGHYWDCGDCVDNDADGKVDAEDPDCLGPCHNAEDTFYGSIPGQGGGNCKLDCYFDQDSGAGNDDCAWDHGCDPEEPEPDSCPYDPETGVGSPPVSCDEARNSVSEQCRDTCLPLVPNGCDCFGCCEIPGANTPVWLGSQVDGQPSCTRDDLGDPERCKPCTQVEACLNPCEECELCVGKRELPPSCNAGDDGPTQSCPVDAQACGLTGQSSCPTDHYCITGCCVLTIK